LFIKDANQISCDFDTDFCGYEANNFFERYTGKSPSISSGPSGDKTTGNIKNRFFQPSFIKIKINLSI
jgi:hypothetical protein